MYNNHGNKQKEKGNKMAVIITDSCIGCGACMDECPVEAILDEDDNPNGEDIYFVQKDICVECISHYDRPACATACPTEGCIIWGKNPTTENATPLSAIIE
jgi:ferredoxin